MKYLGKYGKYTIFEESGQIFQINQNKKKEKII